jgi:hypothetical protein
VWTAPKPATPILTRFGPRWSSVVLARDRCAAAGPFYVFALCSFLIRPLAHVPRLGRYLVIETQPVLILMTAIGAAVTLIYAVAAVAAIVLHGF